MSRTMTKDSMVFDLAEKVGRHEFERPNWPYELTLGDILARALSNAKAKRAAESRDGRGSRL